MGRRRSNTAVSLAGFVTLREESQKSDRFVMRVERIEGNRIVETPERVRLSVRRGMAPPAGAFVEVKAQLEPPLQPLRPGGYDFARDLYFQRIGASGFVRGAVKIVTPPAAPGAWLTLGAYVQGVRDAIDGRIRSVLAGDPGAIASAVITGKRDAISPALRRDVRFRHRPRAVDLRLAPVCFPQEAAGKRITLVFPRQDEYTTCQLPARNRSGKHGRGVHMLPISARVHAQQMGSSHNENDN
jgi:hypothetical protein